MIELSCTLPFLAYIIGISLIDFNINIDNIINHNIKTNINISIPHIFPVDEKLPYTFCVIPATIEEKINIEIPLDTHFSVINSHSRIINTPHTVIVIAANISVDNHVSMTFHHNK
jgi:predicted FMN-binding regulatory protein PaiB